MRVCLARRQASFTPKCHLNALCQASSESKPEQPQVTIKVSDNDMKRIRRLLAPRANGRLLVPQEIVEQFQDLETGGRDAVLTMWAKCSGNKDHITCGVT